MSIHTYELFPPSKYFTCFTTFCLYGNSFLQSQRARALSLTTGLVGRISCLHCCNPPQSLARKPKAHFKLLQVEATKDQFLLSFPIASLFWLTTVWIYPLINQERSRRLKLLSYIQETGDTEKICTRGGSNRVLLNFVITSLKALCANINVNHVYVWCQVLNWVRTSVYELDGQVGAGKHSSAYNCSFSNICYNLQK